MPELSSCPHCPTQGLARTQCDPVNDCFTSVNCKCRQFKAVPRTCHQETERVQFRMATGPTVRATTPGHHVSTRPYPEEGGPGPWPLPVAREKGWVKDSEAALGTPSPAKHCFTTAIHLPLSPFLRGRRKTAAGQAQTTERPDACASAKAEKAARSLH